MLCEQPTEKLLLLYNRHKPYRSSFPYLNHSHMPLSGGNKEWGPALVPPVIGMRAEAQQRFHDIHMALASSHEERRRPVAGNRVHIGLVLEQQLAYLGEICVVQISLVLEQQLPFAAGVLPEFLPSPSPRRRTRATQCNPPTLYMRCAGTAKVRVRVRGVRVRGDGEELRKECECNPPTH